MTGNTAINIDPYLFEYQFIAFKSFVEDESGELFRNFSSNGYTLKEEGYKFDVYREAREKLGYQTWSGSDIGTGKIISSTIEAIEIPENNLLQWQSRYGDNARLHQGLYTALHDPDQCRLVETSLFELYYSSNDAKSFSQLVALFGRKYALIAYLYFIKDKSTYLPIAPTYFDQTFEILGADLKTSGKCSWENYTHFLHLITELKDLLLETSINEVSLLDAHSFAWMLSSHMAKENRLADVSLYQNLSHTERDALVKARVGQGQFRDRLIRYWSCCAVTGCTELPLLRSSHIKPWRSSDFSERLSMYNGLLLSPSLDLCFDSGFITFDDSGNIVISEQLKEKDQIALGLHKNMKLMKLENAHKKFLQYHRNNIYRN